MIYNDISIYNQDAGIFEVKSVEIRDGVFYKIEDESIAGGKSYSGFFMMPGFVNCHTHLAMTILRNYADDLKLMEWLENEIWPAEDILSDEKLSWGAVLAMAEMLSGGTTCFNDMYTSEDRLARDAYKINMRGVVAQGITDFNEEVNRTQKNKIKKLYDAVDDLEDDRKLIKMGITPHAIYTMSADGYKEMKAYARENELLFHTHLSETEGENNDSLRDNNMTPTEYLDSLGVIDENTILAHCVHLNDKDREIIAKRGASIALNPSSNLKLASGIPDVLKMIDSGINICLGTDGASSNNRLSMLWDMQLLSKIVKGSSKDPLALPAKEIIKIATKNGAKALKYEKLGEIKPGYIADYSIFDLDSLNNWPINNPVSAICYSANDSNIIETAVAGKISYKNGEFPGIDIERVKFEVKRISDELNYKKQGGII